MSTAERSPSGNMIYRHQSSDRPFTPASGEPASIDLISEHIEKHIGPIEAVFHEMVSDLIHLDVLLVAPSAARNYYTLITCGMSDLPMTVPEGAEAFRYAELMICLPAAWKLSDESFKNEDNYWPVRSLKTLARLPHEYNTWLYAAHTIPNGNPVQPYASNTKLAGMMVNVPSSVESINEFFTLTVSPGKDVHFFGLMPLYNEEMNFKLQHGAEALLEKLNKAGVTDIVDPNRRNTCKKRFGLF